MIAKIISGGQTGADRGGLDAAIELNIPHGGRCPRGRLAEDGVIPVKYRLQEMNSPDYLKRTEQNIVDSDATVVFTYGAPSGGSKRTVQFAARHKRPCLHADLTRPADAVVEQVKTWLETLGEGIVLNVAGSRESKHAGIQDMVREIMINVLKPKLS